MSRFTIDQAMQRATSLLMEGRLADAEAMFRQILSVQPNHADALNMLGVTTARAGRHEMAEQTIRQAIAVNANQPDFYLNLSLSLEKLQKWVEAIQCCRQAIALAPMYPQAHNYLGVYLRKSGDFAAAIASFQKAIELKPDFAWAYNNLANAFHEARLMDRAISCYEQSLKLAGNHPKFLIGLGNALKDAGQTDRAMNCFDQALAMSPNDTDAISGKAGVLQEVGLIPEAIQHFRRALALDPTSMATHDRLLFAMLHDPAADFPGTFAEKQRWDLEYAKPLKHLIKPPSNAPDKNRKWRIGYVSPDFRGHAVGLFLAPLLANHDRNRFEIFCYSQVRVPDEQTTWFQSRADHWRIIFGRSDDDVAQLIREDRIDILVDLAMHTADHRLLVFARKPAPVQVTYLAYAGGTAVPAIDYRLTDSSLDPDECNDQYYMEKSVRLTGSYWCYHASPDSKPVNALPALSSRKLTFGCLNKFSKISTPTMEVWAEILNAVANSQLVLHAKPGSHRDRLIGFFSQRGIGAGRIQFVPFLNSVDYFETYQRIDIALDPFPYSGGTTTCDALWMGVPVVTLAGKRAVSRASTSILSNADLRELIAESTDQYRRIAIGLANDLPRLNGLRSTLRDRLRRSRLMDAVGYTASIEAAYRAMWPAPVPSLGTPGEGEGGF